MKLINIWRQIGEKMEYIKDMENINQSAEIKQFIQEKRAQYRIEIRKQNITDLLE